MNYRMLRSSVVLLGAGLIQACAPQNSAIANYDCEIVSIPVCTGSPPSITINVQAKTIAPRNYCAPPNSVVRFDVRPINSPLRSTAVVPKNPGDTWMIGTNDPDANEFTVETPATLDEYGYTVIFADGTCIDPRITVE